MKRSNAQTLKRSNAQTHRVTVFLFFSFFMVFTSGCDNTTPETIKGATRSIDGKPIIKVSEADYLKPEFFLPIMKKVAGEANIVAEQLQRRLTKKEGESTSILLKDVFQESSSNQHLSTQYAVESGGGKKEGFVLTLAPSTSYIQNQRLSKTSAITLITRSPDEVAIPEDAAGNEIWPVVLPAVVLGDPNTVVQVSFNKDGTTQIVSGALGKKSEVYDFIYLEDTYVDEGASSGDGSSVWSGGFVPGTYLSLLGIKLEDDQETFGPAEVMMHVSPGDGADIHSNAANHFLDQRCIYVSNIVSGVDASGQPVTVSGPPRNECLSVSTGANGGTYLMPDVNSDGQFYAMYAPYPLAALNTAMQHAVMVEDNKNYGNYSWRSSGNWGGNVLSYNLQTRSWESVYTRVAAQRHYIGSSDAVIPKSGITKIHQNSYFGNELIIAADGNMQFTFGKMSNN